MSINATSLKVEYKSKDRQLKSLVAKRIACWPRVPMDQGSNPFLCEVFFFLYSRYLLFSDIIINSIILY